MSEDGIVICPTCGEIAATSLTAYGIRHSCCGLWSWGGKPLVDAATHDARKKAHEAFDPLWKSGKMTRSDAYKALAKRLGIDGPEAHMSVMKKEIAEMVPRIVKQIGDAP